MDNDKGKKFVYVQNNPAKWILPNDSSLDEEANSKREYTVNDLIEYINGLPKTLTEKIRYAKFALEEGESGTKHIQGFILLNKEERRSFLYKVFTKADIKVARGSIEQASSYVGNMDFIHADGEKKTGKVFWVHEIGNKPQGRASKAKGELSPTEQRLEDIKKSIDNNKGKNIIRQLWHDDFYMMLRFSRAIKEYIADIYDRNEEEAIRIGTITLAKEKELRDEVVRLNKQTVHLANERDNIINSYREEIDLLKMQLKILSGDSEAK